MRCSDRAGAPCRVLLATLVAIAVVGSALPLKAQEALRIVGAPRGERAFTVEQLQGLPTDTTRVQPHHGTAATYAVVSLRRLLAEAGVTLDSLRGRDLTRVVVAEARDGYRVAFSFGELASGMGEREVLVAYQ